MKKAKLHIKPMNNIDVIANDGFFISEHFAQNDLSVTIHATTFDGLLKGLKEAYESYKDLISSKEKNR